MYRNYFYLNRTVIELNNLFNNHKIRSIYSQEKDRIIIECVRGLEERFFLEICVNPGYPYITVKDDFRRARKNVTDLFTNAVGAEIISSEISVQDRIVKFKTSSGDFFFLLRGKFTNLVLLHSGNFSFFKHSTEINEEDLLNELQGHEYTAAFNFPSIELTDNSSFAEQVRKKFPFISKELLQETAVRTDNLEDKEKFISNLNNIMLEMLQERVCIYINHIGKEVNIAPETFRIFQHDEKIAYDSFFTALNFFLSRKFLFEHLGEKEKIVSKFIEKELYKIISRLNKLKTRIENGSREEDYNKAGNLLLVNRYKLSKGIKELEVDNIYSEGERLIIKLDPSLSPQQNIDAYFKKAKNERVNYEKSIQLYQQAEKQFTRFTSLKERFENYKDRDELESIMKELKIKDNIQSSPEKDDLKNKFKQYIIDKIYYVYVGRDSKNNDLLTTRFAAQNDYWFHARSVSGSHVVLKYERTKEAVPKNILKKTASLAAYHSKAKTAGLVPVSYTFKKYVVKKKGMEPGKVALLKEEVLLVRPEIPEGAEYISNE